MKNLAIAVGAFIVVLAGTFILSEILSEDQIPVAFKPLVSIFTKRGPVLPDTLIPSPTAVGSQATKSAMQKQSPFPILTAEDIDGKKAVIRTGKGDIVFEFFSDVPLASSNFIALAEKKFYDGLTFHRREEGFVIQGGDPKGDGTGGPGYKFADEPVTRDYNRGIVAMANSGPNTNGSQFFIMLADYPLPKQYTIFGKVVEGMEVVDKIAVGDKMAKVAIE